MLEREQKYDEGSFLCGVVYRELMFSEDCPNISRRVPPTRLTAAVKIEVAVREEWEGHG